MRDPPLRYFGSAVVLRAGNSLLLQRKTPGYPVEPYVGRTTLVGGFWSTPDDAGPRATLERELREELRPHEFREDVVSELEFFGGYDYRLALLSDDRGAFWTRTYVFEANLSDPERLREAELAEGIGVVVPEIAAMEAEMCWGHDATLEEWGERRGYSIELDGDTEQYDLATSSEPESYTAVDRSRLVYDPLERATDGGDSLGIADDGETGG